jgi:hypothetical protein
MKGVRITKARFEVVEKAFKTLIRLTEDRPDITMSCMFEYFPVSKICSVPNDATAFIRIPYPNTLNVFRWKENTEENLKFARDASKEITDILATGNIELAGVEIASYGNYGAFLLFMEFCEHDWLTR